MKAHTWTLTRSVKAQNCGIDILVDKGTASGVAAASDVWVSNNIVLKLPTLHSPECWRAGDEVVRSKPPTTSKPAIAVVG